MAAPRKKPSPDELTLTPHSIQSFMGRSGEHSAVAATDEIRRLFGTAKWTSKQKYRARRGRRPGNVHGKNSTSRVDVYATPYNAKRWVFFVRGKVLLTVHGPIPLGPTAPGRAVAQAPAVLAAGGLAADQALPAGPLFPALPPLFPQPRCARCQRPVEELVAGRNPDPLSSKVTFTLRCHGAEETVELDQRDLVWLDKVELGEAFVEKPELLA